MYAHYVLYLDSSSFGFLLAIQIFVFVVFGGTEVFGALSSGLRS